MALLAVDLLAFLFFWWAWRVVLTRAWQRPGRDPGAAVLTCASPRPPEASAPAAPSRPAPPPTARRRELGPPLTEDDVISFGLALEAAADVVQSARTEPGRGGAARVRPDARGRS